MSRQGVHGYAYKASLEQTPHQSLTCVVKNTFLQVMEEGSEDNKCSARTRSKSESNVTLSPTRDRPKLPNVDSEEEVNVISVSKIGSNTRIGGSGDDTPRGVSKGPSCSTRTGSPEPSSDSISDSQTEEAARSPPGLSWSPTSKTSWYDQSLEEQSKVPSEAIEALNKLAVVVDKERLKREDLMIHEVTAQLYSFIPFNDEGEVMSLGSILHSEGVCKPCAFFKADRCHKKDVCMHCHFDHEIAKAKSSCSRKSKSKRLRLARERRYQEDEPEPVLRFSL